MFCFVLFCFVTFLPASALGEETLGIAADQVLACFIIDEGQGNDPETNRGVERGGCLHAETSVETGNIDEHHGDEDFNDDGVENHAIVEETRPSEGGFGDGLTSDEVAELGPDDGEEGGALGTLEDVETEVAATVEVGGVVAGGDELGVASAPVAEPILLFSRHFVVIETILGSSTNQRREREAGIVEDEEEGKEHGEGLEDTDSQVGLKDIEGGDQVLIGAAGFAKENGAFGFFVCQRNRRENVVQERGNS